MKNDENDIRNTSNKLGDKPNRAFLWQVNRQLALRITKFAEHAYGKQKEA